MKSFSTVEGKICPIPVKDIDTDMIIPAQFLTSISRDGFGAHLFIRLRDKDPSFPLNLPAFKGAEILVGDSNFGCGSSREHAVWAILGAGFKVVIAKSFADIFSTNSGKNGLLLIKLPEAVVEHLLHEGARRELRLRVDLAAQEVTELGSEGAGTIWKFEYDPFLKYCLLNGIDELDYLRSQSPAIDERRKQLEETFFFDARRPNWSSIEASRGGMK
jgi:3-isopropylmalate/(R)-2-methylmalate dehydratase small subunit